MSFRPVRLRPEWWLPTGVILALLACWEWLASTGRLSALFFPPPSMIAMTLVKLLKTGKLAINLAATLSRVLVGFAIGGLPGLILGLTLGWSSRLRAFIDPFIAAAHPVPKIALLPLIMIIFGIGEASKVMVVGLAAFFPIAINAMAGVRQISPIHFEVAENCGAGPLKVFTRVVVPGSLPLVLTGARLALNSALLLTIAIELVAAQRGLGVMVWFAWQTFRIEELYASVAVTAALGVGFNLLLQRLATHLAPWQVEAEI